MLSIFEKYERDVCVCVWNFRGTDRRVFVRIGDMGIEISIVEKCK